MKIKIFISLVVFAIAGVVSAADAAAAPKKPHYTCGMHPWIIQDHPGNCPICGMKLELVHSTTDASTAVSSTIAIDAATVQRMNIQSVKVIRGPVRRTVRTVGTINYNETTLVDVTTRFNGWIDKLNVDATGQLVHRGEPLFDIYSPDLYSATVDYLTAKNFTSGPGASLTRQEVLNKLRYSGLSDAQIANLKNSRYPSKVFQINAPADGFVIEKNVVQGQMVETGARLYRLADLAIVWVFAQVYEQDLPYIALGQEAVVKLESFSDREFRGRVTYIYPDVDEKTRTARVRLEFENPGYFLKPGMFVSARIVSELKPSALLVPDSAVLRSGEKNTVFVALPGGKFDPRTIALGQQSENGLYEVISGLNEGESVVRSGQFMLDSESQLREAIQKMSGVTPAPQTTVNPAAAPAVASADAGGVVYVCPMPGHISITYDHPGKCPICDMALVPVTDRELKQLQPGGKILHYTCPMPEHSSVHSAKPGKCPICAMTLIPVMEPPPLATVKSNAISSVLYTCPMADHADVVSDQPGKCTKCGMDLVPTTTVTHGKIAEDNWRKQHPQ